MKILQLSCMHLQLAEKQLLAQFTNEDSVHDACFFVQWAAVQFHYAILLEHLSLAKPTMLNKMPNQVVPHHL